MVPLHILTMCYCYTSIIVVTKTYMIYNIIYILHKFNIYLGATEIIPYIALNKYATNSTMDN